MLFQSVRQHKVDLMGVPLVPICQAYYAYILDHCGEDLELAASALVALSYLLDKKASLLLPSPEQDEPEMPEEGGDFEYVPTIQEFELAMSELQSWHESRSHNFFRGPSSEVVYELPYDLSEVTSGDLARALERLLRRAVPEKPEILGKPRRSLADQMTLVARELPIEFALLENIVVGEFTRSEIVWWFLALLELIRLGQARVKVEGEEVFFARAEGRA
jgi:segregation and condensation protein A